MHYIAGAILIAAGAGIDLSSVQVPQALLAGMIDERTPVLNDEQWVPSVLAEPECNLPLYTDTEPLSLTNFQKRYKGRFPVAWERPLSVTWGIRQASSRDALQQHAAMPVLLASSNSFSHDKHQCTLGDYLNDYMGRHSPDRLANETWYLFGDSVKDEWTDLLRGYAMPMDASDDEGLAAFGLGGQFSGVAFHTHGAAFAEAVWGRKRWWLAPPGKRPNFQGDRHQLQWVLETLPLYQATMQRAGNVAATYQVEATGTSQRKAMNASTVDLVTCELGPGQVLYIPPGWWHATLNTGQYNTFVSTFTREKA